MNQAERERLVDHYLSGAMSVPEEQEFFIQVALNDELRQTLKAYRIVENALQKDGATAKPPANSERSRAQIMGLLAATAPVMQHGAAGTAEAVAKTSASAAKGLAGSGWLTAGGLTVAGGAIKIALGVVAASALVVGTLVVAPMIDSGNAGSMARPIHRDTVSVVGSPLPSSPVEPTVMGEAHAEPGADNTTALPATSVEARGEGERSGLKTATGSDNPPNEGGRFGNGTSKQEKSAIGNAGNSDNNTLSTTTSRKEKTSQQSTPTDSIPLKIEFDLPDK
jgi:hypothetical protein